MTKPASSDPEEIAARAASSVSTGILQQLMLVYLDENLLEKRLRINSKAGSVHALAYIIGYSKAVHGFYEASTGVYINDGTMGLAALGSIFRGSTLEECLHAKDRAIDALEKDVPGTRDAFSLGKKDYESLGDGGMTDHCGLVSLLGIGGAP
ncbi:MAG: hypothetical protein H5U21_10210 [Porphyrobacter sp.]|nr:hypothetical protein [Porphyrobacter sp.]